MDRQTLVNYGWIVICALVITVMIAFATPFGTYAMDAATSIADGFINTGNTALNDETHKQEIIDRWEDKWLKDDADVPQRNPELNHKNTIPEGGVYYVNFNASWNDELEEMEYFADEVLEEGETFPEPQPGDLYSYGAYEYVYQYDRCCSCWSMWCCEERTDSWTVYCAENVSYPGKILNSINDHDVTKLAYEAFESKDSVWEVDLSEAITLTEISYGTFSGCSELSSVILPETITSIQNYAFSGCAITTFDFSNLTGLTYIGEGAFQNSDIERITIPASVNVIGENALDECEYLEEINVHKDNKNYCSVNNVLYTKDMKTLIKYPELKSDDTLTVINGVETIEEKAFSNCQYIQSISLPNSVKEIKGVAFYNCPELQTILMPAVETIGSRAFGQCKNIKTVNIPQTTTFIGDDVFEGCTSLESINVDNNNSAYCSENGILYTKDMKTLIRYPQAKADASFIMPNSVEIIKMHCFSETTVKDVSVSENVTKFNAWTFDDCKVETLTLKNKSVKLAYCAIYECSELNTINFNGTSAEFTKALLDNAAIASCGKYQVVCTDKTLQRGK